MEAAQDSREDGRGARCHGAPVAQALWTCGSKFCHVFRADTEGQGNAVPLHCPRSYQVAVVFGWGPNGDLDSMWQSGCLAVLAGCTRWDAIAAANLRRYDLARAYAQVIRQLREAGI